MELLNKSLKLISDEFSVELQQKQKQEYKHLGQYWVNKSLKLFQYNPVTEEISLVERMSEFKEKRTIYLIVEDGKLIAKDLDYEKAQVDSRMIFFEAMNHRTAKIRLDKWKKGKLTELCNLREIKESIFKLV